MPVTADDLEVEYQEEQAKKAEAAAAAKNSLNDSSSTIRHCRFVLIGGVICALLILVSPQAPWRLEGSVGPKVSAGQRVGPESPVDQKAGPESPADQTVGPESPVDQKAGPESPAGQTVGPESPAGNRAGLEGTAGTADYKDIVLGMVMNMDPKNFVVFCATLRTVSEVDALMFVNAPTDPSIEEIAARYKVKLEVFDIATDPLLSNYHPSTLRWDMMKKFLERPRNQGVYGRIWMIDVRDSMFQSDPFQMLPQYEPGKKVFLAFSEVGEIKNCAWNGNWVKDCFGQSMLQEIGHNRIICSGVSAGTIDAVLPYLDKMAAISMGEVRENLPSHLFPKCERNGVDQGVHNVLVYTQAIEGLKILDQLSGPVANMQAAIGKVDAEYKVANRLGESYAVVHQYDRNINLQKYLFRKYVYWMDTSDPMNEWRETPECASFQVKQNVDAFKSRCDLSSKGGATGPATCCKQCKAKVGCKAFTYTEAGHCFFKSCAENPQSNSMQGALSAWLA